MLCGLDSKRLKGIASLGRAFVGAVSSFFPLMKTAISAI
jgi:hypothetical protein